MSVMPLDEKDVEYIDHHNMIASELITRYGELAYTKVLLDDELKELTEKLKQMQTSSDEFSETLHQKYGNGTIDFSAKTFTPDKT